MIRGLLLVGMMIANWSKPWKFPIIPFGSNPFSHRTGSSLKRVGDLEGFCVNWIIIQNAALLSMT